MAQSVNTGTTGSSAKRGARKTRLGLVVSDKMEKTVVVAIERRFPHPLYGSLVTRTQPLKSHNADNPPKTRDPLRSRATPPWSSRTGNEGSDGQRRTEEDGYVRSSPTRAVRRRSGLRHGLIRRRDVVVHPLRCIGLRQTCACRHKLRQIGFVGRRDIAVPDARRQNPRGFGLHVLA